MKIFLPLIPGLMWRILLVLPKLRRYLFLCAVFFMAGNLLAAQDSNADEAPADDPQRDEIHTDVIRWYRSNSAAMTLAVEPSRQAAFSNEYSLSVRNALPREIPLLVLPHFNSAYRIELRTLYHEGSPTRRQWFFRDGRGITRLTASGSGSRFAERGAGVPPPGDEEERSSGIIEIRNSNGDLTREFQYDEDLSEWDFRYFYRENVLVRVEIWFRGPPDESEPPVFALVFTDLYRYTRAGSLRAVDRTLHRGALESLRIAFPRLGPGASTEDKQITHGGLFTSEFFAGTDAPDGVTISYNIDGRGRILGEVWRGEGGQVLGELLNTWSGDRLQSVSWKSVNDERLIEFEYDADGHRIVERNFRNGVLERSVTTRGSMEIEDIFMGGRLVLRAIWEGGVKISEERISAAGGNP
jgi:hypothetical protein